MNPGQTLLITCSFSRSAFSGERIFRITDANNEDYVGIAPVGYCYHKSKKQQLGENDPADKKTVEGRLEGRVIKNGGPIVEVALPDGESIRVRSDKTQLYLAKETEQEYVPVRS